MHSNNGHGVTILTTADVRTTEHWIADADPQNISESPIDSGYLCWNPAISTYYIFITYDSSRSIILMKQKQLDELREMMVDRV